MYKDKVGPTIGTNVVNTCSLVTSQTALKSLLADIHRTTDAKLFKRHYFELPFNH